jgi:hypothetical protein
LIKRYYSGKNNEYKRPKDIRESCKKYTILNLKEILIFKLENKF